MSSRSEAADLRGSRGLLILFAVCSLFGILSAAQTHARMTAAGMAHPFLGILLFQLAEAYGWGAGAVGIFWAAARFPLEHGWPSALVHLGFSLGLSCVYNATMGLVAIVVQPFPPIRFTWAQVRFGPGLDFLVYWGILGCAYAVALHDRSRAGELRASQLSSSLSEARLEALKLQLQPHFLFNTLNSVTTLIRANENQRALAMLLGLCDLLRHSLQQTRSNECPLSEEVEMATRYLDIQRERFPDRLKFVLRVGEGVLDVPVPTLLLQPLLENAVQHGVAQCEGPGAVELEASRVGDELWIEVSNTGPVRNSPPDPGGGRGLALTRARLEGLHPGRSSVELRLQPGGGARVEVRLPWSRAVAS